MKDILEYRYHRSHTDGRYEAAAKYRKEAELSQEERELDEVASDIIEAMETDLDNVIGSD